MKAKRYDLRNSSIHGEHMAETEDGAFVDWRDYERALELLAQAMALLREAREDMNPSMRFRKDENGEMRAIPGYVCISKRIDSFLEAHSSSIAEQLGEILLPEPAADTRHARYGWNPGPYYNTCHVCSASFIGGKRASLCADCAYALPDPGRAP